MDMEYMYVLYYYMQRHVDLVIRNALALLASPTIW